MGETIITLDSVISRNDDMVAGVVDSDVMMMSIETGKYYQLNAMGGEICEILSEPLTVAALCDVLEGRFTVKRDILERETLQFLRELCSRKILSVAR